MTWKDIKTATLQKMYAIDTDVPLESDVTLPYIKSMPAAATEGFMLLASVGGMPLKRVTVSNADGTTRFDMRTIADDFLSFAGELYFDGGGVHRRVVDYTTEAAHILVLPEAPVGTFTVWYNGAPQRFSAETPDSQPIELYPNAVVLLPLYIASQLYKDDDLPSSIQMRNEFEAGREALCKLFVRTKEEIVSTRGWW